MNALVSILFPGAVAWNHCDSFSLILKHAWLLLTTFITLLPHPLASPRIKNCFKFEHLI